MTEAPDVAAAAARETATPFPGLRPFSIRDHDYFFGREDQTFALCMLVLRHHFVAVVGSSGSGKSSIVRAGLLPKLDDENSRSPAKPWQWLTMRPGVDPLGRLADALASFPTRQRGPHFQARRDRIAATLRSSSHGISDAIGHTELDKSARLVLVVDQFEELFRYMSTSPRQADRIETIRRHDQATDFVQLLLAATRNHDSPIRVVITMRSDFIGDCALFQGLPEAVSGAQFLVPSLSRDQCREAIYAPIKLCGAEIDSELVERLVNDASGEPDQLPLLQHCLSRLWARAGSANSPAAAGETTTKPVPPSRRHLSLGDYAEIGGLAGALSGHADEIVSSLPDDKEATVEQIFRTLAEIDKDSRAVRRARTLAQLIAETGAPAEDIWLILDRFRADECSFIVPPLSYAETSALGDGTVVDVGHEALLRRWKRVSGDPEATGERADKRDIGWLKKEQRDGESYLFLRSCVDPESPNDSRLPANQTERYWSWWKQRQPNPTWAARYGGWFDEVKQLVTDSHAESLASRRRKNLAYTAAALVPVAVVAGFFIFREQQKQAEQTFKLAVNSAEKFSKRILETFNAGEMTTTGAAKLYGVAAEMYEQAGTIMETSETGAARVSWMIISSDVDKSLGQEQQARAKVEQAENSARKYLAKDPNDRKLNQLLYASLFRIGDLDLADALTHRDSNSNPDPVLSKKALGEYQEAQRVADALLTLDVQQPRGFETADINYLAEQRFNKAFSTNKVGEAMQVGGDLAGALAKFEEALETAKTIENTSKMEWKLQSATTKLKIASVLLTQNPPALDGALRNYSEAIARQQTIIADDPANNIVRSNLASAYEGRAGVLVRKENFEDAFDSYRQATKMFGELVDNDARDVLWLQRLARVQRKYGEALEAYARSQHQPLDKALELYTGEVATRTKLVERSPSNDSFRTNLLVSRKRLQSVTAEAAGTAPENSRNRP
jgi:tetratricopeptide (TPR) repeat protein